jgi:hypothetical protein
MTSRSGVSPPSRRSRSSTVIVGPYPRRRSLHPSRIALLDRPACRPPCPVISRSDPQGISPAFTIPCGSLVAVSLSLARPSRRSPSPSDLCWPGPWARVVRSRPLSELRPRSLVPAAPAPIRSVHSWPAVPTDGRVRVVSGHPSRRQPRDDTTLLEKVLGRVVRGIEVEDDRVAAKV